MCVCVRALLFHPSLSSSPTCALTHKRPACRPPPRWITPPGNPTLYQTHCVTRTNSSTLPQTSPLPASGDSTGQTPWEARSSGAPV